MLADAHISSLGYLWYNNMIRFALTGNSGKKSEPQMGLDSIFKTLT